MAIYYLSKNQSNGILPEYVINRITNGAVNGKEGKIIHSTVSGPFFRQVLKTLYHPVCASLLYYYYCYY